MRTADWYFDVVSPYAYLQLHRLPEIARRVALRYRPVLFAGLLDHFGQLGPAEIVPKRLFTYRHIAWLADRMGVPFKLPAAHPFNPLKLLRLAVAADGEPAVVMRLFTYVWRDGRLPEEAGAWSGLLGELELPDAEERIGSSEVKQALLENGREAIAAGVFGVPTLVLDRQVFWGLNATDMLLDYIADPRPFERRDRQFTALPAAAVRRASHRAEPRNRPTP